MHVESEMGPVKEKDKASVCVRACVRMMSCHGCTIVPATLSFCLSPSLVLLLAGACSHIFSFHIVTLEHEHEHEHEQRHDAPSCYRLMGSSVSLQMDKVYSLFDPSLFFGAAN